MNRKGFTLVELLAVIVILAVILVIAVPKITNVISDTKGSALLSSAKLIAKSAESKYATNEMLGNNDTITCESVAKINTEDYKYCEIIMRDGVAYVNITGKGKFEGIGVYGVTKEDGTIIHPIELANTNTDLATRVLLNKATTNNTEGLMFDDFGNLRYSGGDKTSEKTDDIPNYVSFNEEKWRIIGIFDVSNGTKVEKRIKIIREAFSTGMSWDSSASTVNSGYGVNEWSQADLKTVLNGYYIGVGPTCNYCNGAGQATCSQDCAGFITPKLSSGLNLINNAIWNTGGNYYSNPNVAPYGLPLQKQYIAERGTSVMQNPSDGITRTTTWKGLVGLMYASDYGYASTNSSCRTNLRAGVTYENSTYNYDKVHCKIDNWLYKNTGYWTFSPYINSFSQLYVNNTSSVGIVGMYNTLGVRPSVYIRSDVRITGGNGTYASPYVLSAA